jgi:isoamylase
VGASGRDAQRLALLSVEARRPEPALRVVRGHPLPLGASLRRDGINFAVFTTHATSVRLLLFRAGEAEPILDHPLDPRFNRTGDVWHALVLGIDPGIEYVFRAAMDPNPAPRVHRFEPEHDLLDPYAKAVSGAPVWGDPGAISPARAQARVRPRRSRVVEEEFDWGDEQPLGHHLADSVIYEAHVRGFTVHPSSGVAHPGTFRGLVEKIPYLQALGVTAVELMPVTEFEENDNTYRNPRTGEALKNFWGYQPLGFFAPKAGYAANGRARGEVREFREMVRALHSAGIEVILDMVFNHTGEGNENGPTVSFRGLDNATYYLLEPVTGRYLDYSGCGNTLNCNHPVVRGMILGSLRYWVTEMHVDGFRFDLASILGRGRDGEVLANPPLLEVIAGDAVLARTKLIAEAWDAAGLYQVGTFPHWGRWAEWNGRFRDDVRRFVRGDRGMVSALATRLAGSSDLYQHDGREPHHSVNFVTSHDGFTLADLVSYKRKHNRPNGQGDRDGQDENFSANMGVEGPSTSPPVIAVRRRQTRNLAALLLMSQGVPMILGGDELGRTQAGNNNAWSQDNETSWIDWTLAERNADLLRFLTLLVRFRHAHPSLRRRSFTEPDPGRPWVVWQGTKRGRPEWSTECAWLGMHLLGLGRDDEIFLMANAAPVVRSFELPLLSGDKRWRLFLDTSLEPPREIVEPGEEPPVARPDQYEAGPRSVVVLVGR